MLGFSTAAWKLAPRDSFIGWPPELREKNLRHAHEACRAQEGHLAATPPKRLEAHSQSMKSPTPSPGKRRITIPWAIPNGREWPEADDASGLWKFVRAATVCIHDGYGQSRSLTDEDGCSRNSSFYFGSTVKIARLKTSGCTTTIRPLQCFAIANSCPKDGQASGNRFRRSGGRLDHARLDWALPADLDARTPAGVPHVTCARTWIATARRLHRVEEAPHAKARLHEGP